MRTFCCRLACVSGILLSVGLQTMRAYADGITLNKPGFSIQHGSTDLIKLTGNWS